MRLAPQGKHTVLLVALCLVGMGVAAAAPPVPLEATGVERIPPGSVEVLEDPSAALSIADVLAPAGQERFRPRAQDHLNFGVTRSAIWLRFALRNDAGPQDTVLLVDNPRLERVELYVLRADGRMERSLNGDRVPMAERAVVGREVAFPLRLAPQENAVVVLRMVTSVTLSVTLSVLTPSRFQIHAHERTGILTAILGAMALLALIALGLCIRHRDLRYLIYFCLVVSALVMFTTQDGVSTELLWPDHPDWTWNVRALVTFLVAGSIVSYIVVSLDVRHASASLHWLGVALAAACIGCAAVFPFLPGQFANRSLHVLASGVLLVSLASIAVAVRNRHRLSVLFLISFAPNAVAIAAASAHNGGWIAGPTRLIVDGFKVSLLAFLAIQLVGLRGQVRREEQSLAKHTERVDAWQGTLQATTLQGTLQVAPEAAPAAGKLADKPVLVHTLGQLEVWREQAPVFLASRGTSRAQRLLALLLAGGKHGTTKALVIDQMWPDADGDLAEQSFRTALYRLRQAIGAAAVELNAGQLRLNPEIVWDDGSQFEALAAAWIERLRETPAAAATAPAAEAGAAMRLYGGDFLPALDLPAVQRRREQLRGQFQDLLLRVATGHAAADRHRDAAELYRLAERRGIASEAVYQGLIRAQAALGHSLDAMQSYERCKAWLAEAHGAAPSAETEQLRKMLLASAPPASASA